MQGCRVASVIDICNYALMRVGTKSSIMSLDEASPEANVCKLVFDQALRASLRLHPWNFASASGALAELPSPRSDWAYRYALPSDCVHARRVLGESRTSDRVPFEIGVNDTRDGKTLLCDSAAAVLVYTAYIADPTLYDSSFVDCLAWRVAYEVAMPITADRSIQGQCLQAWTKFMPEAAALDANEGFADPNRAAPWISGRA
jgi:hypothetical protein